MTFTPSKLKIVHVVPRDFRRADDGGRIKTAALASSLAAVGELHVVDMDRRPTPDFGFVAGKLLSLPFGGEANFYSSVNYADPQASALQRIWTTVKRSVTRRSRAHRRACAMQIVNRLAPDIVVADDITGALVAAHCPNAKRIIHTHNVESALHMALFAQRGRGKWKRKAKQYERWERELLPKVEQVWAVSAEDAAHYRGLGVRDIVITPNVIQDDRFEPNPEVGEAGKGLYFGSLWYEPNRDAALYLAGMAQRLISHFPTLRLHVTGRGASPELVAALKTPGVELLGFVPSLREAARTAAAIVIPIAWGGGTKVKTVEAMALGKPIVTTPEGAAGLDLEDGVHAIVRPLGPGFDLAVMEVLANPTQYREMGLSAQRLAQEQYSLTALKSIVSKGLAGILSKSRSGS